MSEPRMWLLKSEPGRIGVTVPRDGDALSMGEAVRVLEMEPVLHLLELLIDAANERNARPGLLDQTEALLKALGSYRV